MRFSYENKTVAITGGGNGIGRAMAEAFAEMGAAVGILDMNEESGEETVREITGSTFPPSGRITTKNSLVRTASFGWSNGLRPSRTNAPKLVMTCAWGLRLAAPPRSSA